MSKNSKHCASCIRQNHLNFHRGSFIQFVFTKIWICIKIRWKTQMSEIYKYRPTTKGEEGVSNGCQIFRSLIHGRGRRKHVALSVHAWIHGRSDRSALDKEESSWNQNYAWAVSVMLAWCAPEIACARKICISIGRFLRGGRCDRAISLGSRQKPMELSRNQHRPVKAKLPPPRNRFGRSPFLENVARRETASDPSARYFSLTGCAWELIEPFLACRRSGEKKKEGGEDESRGTQDDYRWKSRYLISSRIEKSARLRRDSLSPSENDAELSE